MQPSILSVTDFCATCSIGRTKAFQLIAVGEVDAVKIGRRTLVTRESIDALIKRGAADAKRARGL